MKGHVNRRSSGRQELLAEGHRKLPVNVQKAVINKKNVFQVRHRILLLILFNGSEAEPEIPNQTPRCYKHRCLRNHMHFKKLKRKIDQAVQHKSL